MKLYTSCYSNFSKFPSSWLCIGISRYTPKEFCTTDIQNYLYTPNNILAPSKELLEDIKNGRINQEEYTKRYFEELGVRIRSLGYSNSNEYFATMISEFSKEPWEAIVFLCYEKPNEFCHRHLLSALMRKNGFDIQEWYPQSKVQSKEDLSISALF